MNRETIYFDYAAATPLDERVFAAMQPYFEEKFYNPSSPYLPAKQVRSDIEEARTNIAGCIGVKPDEITFTAGATESINIAFHGILSGGGHVVISAIDHQSALAPAKRYPHAIVRPTEKGIVQPEAVEKAITDETRLVSIVLADSELGNVQPMKEIAQVVKKIRNERLKKNNKTPLYLHTDASQGVGYIDIHVSRLGVDLVTLNAGKIYGPKQTGILWAASNVQLAPFILGGGQEKNLRSGTENAAGIIGFSKALEIAEKKRKQEYKRLEALKNDLKKRFEDEFPDITFSGHKKRQLPNFLHVAFPGVDAERLIFQLEVKGILVATGSACAANYDTRSHILTAIGMQPEVADGSLRITLGRLTTEEDIKRGADEIIKAVKKEQD